MLRSFPKGRRVHGTYKGMTNGFLSERHRHHDRQTLPLVFTPPGRWQGCSQPIESLTHALASSHAVTQPRQPRENARANALPRERREGRTLDNNGEPRAADRSNTTPPGAASRNRRQRSAQPLPERRLHPEEERTLHD